MNDRQTMANGNADFSLVMGGPLFQILLRARLLQPTMDLLPRRIFAFILFTWIPLALLTAFGGNFLQGVRVPFLLDASVHARFLLLVPLLISAELLVHRRIRLIVDQFREHGLIAPHVESSFDSIIAWAMRLRNSVVVEVALLTIAFTAGYWFWRTHSALHVATWYAHGTDTTMQLTAAGYWYAFVSNSNARFILLRWYFRFCVWYLFLFRVSRLQLRLNPLHPDRAGGLGFLGGSVDAFVPVLIAQSAFLAVEIAGQIWHQGAKLPDFKLLIAGALAFLAFVALLPLMFFVFHQAQAKRTGLREFGVLASRYAAEFRQKWLRAGHTGDEPLLGSADLQSLADLGNSYTVVREMRLLPFGKEVVIRLLIILALPLLPLTLTMIPLEEALERLMSIML